MSHLFRRSSSLIRQDGRQRNTGAASRIPMPSMGAPSRDPPGLKRSKSTLGLCTPQGSSGYTTPQNNFATPVQLGSYSGKKIGSQKETRNLQDKMFQREAIAKIIAYFEVKCPSLLVQGDIRPMSIKMFIEIMNFFFGELGIYDKDNIVQLKTSDYQQAVTHWMRLLEYPGSVSKSWLTIVNAPQSFPNVLGLLSWLVSLDQATSAFEPANYFDYESHTETDQRVNIAYFKGCTVAARDDCDLDEISLEVIRFIRQEYAVTDEDLEFIEDENRDLESKLNDPEMLSLQDKHDELEQHLAQLRSQNLQNSKTYESIITDINKLNAEIARKRRHILALKHDIAKGKQRVEELQSEVKTQAISKHEYDDLMKKCDNLRKEIEFTEKECDDNEKLIVRYEYEVAAKRDKILQNASTFNRKMIQLEQQIPELKGLRARSNLESAGVLEDVEGLHATIKEVRSRLATEFESLGGIAEERKKTLDALKDRLRALNAKEKAEREALKNKKEEMARMENEFSEKRRKLKDEIEEKEKQLNALQNQEKDHSKIFEIVAEKRRRLDKLESVEVQLKARHDELWMKMEAKLKKTIEEVDRIQEDLDRTEARLDKQAKEFEEQLKMASA